jgi:hypothetical protein
VIRALKRIPVVADGPKRPQSPIGRREVGGGRFEVPIRRGACEMHVQAKAWRRLGDVTGLVCLMATLSLLSPGVHAVRADDAPLMSVDPALVAAAERSGHPEAAPEPARTPPSEDAPAPAAPASNPFVSAAETDRASRPGVSGIEVQPGVVVLNTRGYNYGPPPTPLTPEALAQEAAPR